MLDRGISTYAVPAGGARVTAGAAAIGATPACGAAEGTNFSISSATIRPSGPEPTTACKKSCIFF